MSALDEYLTHNRDLSLTEACERWERLTGQDQHDIDAQLRREREERNEHFRQIDGY